MLKSFGSPAEVSIVTSNHGATSLRPKLLVYYALPDAMGTPTPSATQLQTSTPTMTPTPTKNPSFGWQTEEEDGTLVPPMVIGQDPDALKGQFVHTPPDQSGGEVSFTLDLPFADTYYLWGRGMGLSWGQNSFFVSMDGGPETGYEIPPFGDQWTWGWNQIKALTLGPGPHALRFRAREAGARLDALLITNNPTYVPPLFTWRQEAEEATIVPPMAIGEDPGASAGAFVHSSSTTVGEVTFRFNVPATGNYCPWARVMGLSWGENSFLVFLDGAEAFHYELPQFGGQWTWG